MKIRLRLFFAFLFLAPSGWAEAASEEAPNVLWIYVDDMSDWMGCYGHTAIETPHIDELAETGVRFDRAYMPSPVCSTTRSALITGAMQTSHGLHHHRTMIKKPLPEGVLTVPELFRQAGYLTFNEEKTDYNFAWERDQLYSPEFKRPKVRGHWMGTDLTWLKQLQGKKFFGQIQLKGGKLEGEAGAKYPMPSRVEERAIQVPPYYPDDPVFRNAIARHYEQVAFTDEQVGAILAALKEYDLWENTAVFFFTDHGSPLPRSKQFLYEEGTKVPLIVNWPAGRKDLEGRGNVRADLVHGIDISATSLALAGIEVPKHFEGRSLFEPGGEERPFVISARDRCGIAVDRIRAVRTADFRYLRNYHTDRSLFQPQYRDKFATLVRLRERHGEGRLDALQASYHEAGSRPAEELYDLRKDPHQTINLASNPEYREVLEQHRSILKQWEDETDDKGRYAASREELKAVYDYAKGKVASPEFDFLKGESSSQ